MSGPTMNAKQSENKKKGAAPLGPRPASTGDNPLRGKRSSGIEVEMRDVEHDENINDTTTVAAVAAVAADTSKRSKKKRRIVKTPDKKYNCPQPDCTKSYSRAEHLYRHQLNHQPKQIYRCDFPGCDRDFVRADLCTRHKERHTAKGSHLQRKDAFMHSQRQQAAAQNDSLRESATLGATTNMNSSPVDSAHPANASTFPDPSSFSAGQHQYTPSGGEQRQQQQQQQQYTHQTQNILARPPSQQQPQQNASLPPIHANASSIDTNLGVNGPYNPYGGSFNTAQGVVMSPQQPDRSRRYNMQGQFDQTGPATTGYSQLPMHPPPVPHPPPPPPNNAVYPQPGYQNAQDVQGSQYSVAASGYNTLPSLGAFQMPASISGRLSPANLASVEQYGMSAPDPMVSDFGAMEQFGYYLPVFNSDGFNRSPPSAIDHALFNQIMEGGMALDEPSPPDTDYGMPMGTTNAPQVEEHNYNSNRQPFVPAAPRDLATRDLAPKAYIMDLSLKESDVSEKKQNRLISLVKSFEDIEGMPGRKIKEDILSGDTDDPNHPLSINMLKTCITSFWIHIHQQIPILHRPTFNPNTCPDLLLLALMCLGACCLERTHPVHVIKNCAELAFFAAYHIRWEVFKDAEFRPTAKLWTFQTMLFLELFEKMYSTRALHERAHVHHATTLAIMRRGSSLIGRGVNDETCDDPTRTPPGPAGSINTSGQNTPDAWWNKWITREATNRAAFAAFVIDSTHAPIFSHNANMASNELKMDLPCDEALWSATSSSEVRQIEASLRHNSFKPIAFMDALRCTLSGQKVRTNPFGRIIIMAGLLNYSVQCSHQDSQVESVDSSGALGATPTRWRPVLSRAFNFWRRDFDESLPESEPQVGEQHANKSTCHKDHRDNVFESRTCLQSLAHMAMNVSIVDCEIFAGSERALGRMVTGPDRKKMEEKMHAWAHTSRARDAVFYALQFLREVLVPEADLAKLRSGQAPPVFPYSAKDDYLLNRPYIVYLACMTVWAYGYAIDGPLQNLRDLSTQEMQIYDMHQYLGRVGGVRKPSELEHMKDRNALVGLLMLMRDCFMKPRWELLHESSAMLNMGLELLLSGPEDAQQHA